MLVDEAQFLKRHRVYDYKPRDELDIPVMALAWKTDCTNPLAPAPWFPFEADKIDEIKTIYRVIRKGARCLCEQDALACRLIEQIQTKAEAAHENDNLVCSSVTVDGYPVKHLPSRK